MLEARAATSITRLALGVNFVLAAEFHQTISVDGNPVKASGTVCQQPDGSWRIMP